jgi:hypothetical protein
MSQESSGAEMEGAVMAAAGDQRETIEDPVAGSVRAEPPCQVGRNRSLSELSLREDAFQR